MDKAATYKYLEDLGIWMEITEHEAVMNMEEVAQLDLPYPELEAKNLFLREGGRGHYCLVTVKGDKRVDLKKFRAENSTKALRFASPEELMDTMALTSGAVSPLGMLADDALCVRFFFDKDFLEDEGIIGVHPNENTATIWLRANDLVDVIKNHGNEVHIVEMPTRDE